MVDLTDPYWSHGVTGTKPPDGLNKAGGDQYEAEYYDFLADKQSKQASEKNNAIQRRTRDYGGNRRLDGLIPSVGSGTREVDFSSSSGAYVNGQFTGSISATSVSLSSNGGSSTRTDAVYIDTNGNIAVKEGTTTVPTTTMKIAEVLVSTTDELEPHNYAQRVTNSGATNWRPRTARGGDTLYNERGSNTSTGTNDTYEVYDGDTNQWQPLVFADGRQKRTGTQDYNNNKIINLSGAEDPDGDGLFVEKKGDTWLGSMDANGHHISGVGQFGFARENFQTMFMHSDSGVFTLRDTGSGPTDGNLPILRFGQTDDMGKYWNFKGGRIYNRGGSFYMGNAGGKNPSTTQDENDSYDLVFQNEPSGEELHMHYKQDPPSMSIGGTFLDVFRSGDNESLFAADVGDKTFHTHQLRNMDDGGTPIARGNLGALSDPGDMYLNDSNDLLMVNLNGTPKTIANLD